MTLTRGKDSYKFVTYIYNQCFTEFIGKYITEKKLIGLDHHTPNHSVPIHSYGKHYFDAVALDDLRDEILKEKYINPAVLKRIIEKIAAIYVSAHYDPELKKANYRFLKLVQSEYGISLHSYFKRCINVEKAKKPQFKPYVKQKPRETKREEPPIKAEITEEPTAQNEETEPESLEVSLETKVAEKSPTQRKGPRSEPYSKIPSDNPLRPLLIPLILALIIVIAILIVSHIPPKIQNITSTNITIQEPTKKTITEEVPIEISLREYLVNWEEYNNKEVTLEGYLQNDIEGTKEGGIYVDSIIDDFGRSIPLKMLTPEQKALFVKKGTTKGVYNVTGMLNRKYPGVELTVSKIVPTERQMTTMTREVTITRNEETVKEVPEEEPKEDGVSFDKAWNGVSSFFESISESIKDMKLKEKGSKLAKEISSLAENGSKVVEQKFEEITAPPSPISNKTKEIEQAILTYTNEERTNQGVRALRWDSKLADIARAHSLDMVENDFFAHTNLKGEDPSARANKAGYDSYKSLGGGYFSIGIAENIGKMPTGSVTGIGYVSSDPDSIARAQVSSWMDSPGHRSNILNPQYDVIGIGVAYDGLYYVCTQDFQ